MTEKTAIKKTRKPTAPSKASQIRKLFEQGKLTPKQIGAKVGAPMPYVYVVRSKMKAEAGGLPAVAEKKIPVLGGIQEVANEHEARVAPAMQAPIPISSREQLLLPMRVCQAAAPCRGSLRTCEHLPS